MQKNNYITLCIKPHSSHMNHRCNNYCKKPTKLPLLLFLIFDSQRVESIYKEQDFLPPSKRRHQSSSGQEAVPRLATSLLNLKVKNVLFGHSDVVPLVNYRIFMISFLSPLTCKSTSNQREPKGWTQGSSLPGRITSEEDEVGRQQCKTLSSYSYIYSINIGFRFIHKNCGSWDGPYPSFFPKATATIPAKPPRMPGMPCRLWTPQVSWMPSLDARMGYKGGESILLNVFQS